MKMFVIDGDGKPGQPSSLEEVVLADSKLIWIDLYQKPRQNAPGFIRGDERPISCHCLFV
ncbi:MAG: hypothetical protein KKB90_07955 [Actinobacteria bacterium]|nr:hypothetical protein [Actinomycetota bacterium]MCG2819336.1 hypothetical protein [Actinomycetes bacterium]MBU4218881.1 hypothetical protein [Actinomycetota bacterium]MBU4358864.1 hypothetical protein [Actinomycetota bacterium]MBU4392249.1 hypothetical protein [Actinomycetota bacterium]